MDRKLIKFAREAGFPVSTDGAFNFSMKKKKGLIGYEEVQFDEMIQKLSDLLFDDFVTQWWVQRHGLKMEKRY